MPKLKSLAMVALVGVLAHPGFARAQGGQRTFLLVVDDLHLEFRSTPRIRELIRKVFRMLTHEGDSVALVTTGFSSVAVPPTAHLERVMSGLARITGGSLKSNQNVDPQYAAERLRRARTAIATARDAIRGLASRTTGPVVVLYFSEGYAEQAVTADLAELASDAYRANAVIHAFEPHGLIVNPAPAPNAGNESVWESYYRDTRQSLRGLAVSTGGLMISTRGAFIDALPHIARTVNQ